MFLAEEERSSWLWDPLMLLLARARAQRREHARCCVRRLADQHGQAQAPFSRVPLAAVLVHTRGLSKLVRVQFLISVQRGAILILASRWEVIGPSGSSSPALDADRSSPARAKARRRPLGDRLLPAAPRPGWRRARPGSLRRTAIVTAWSLLGELAEAITGRNPDCSLRAAAADRTRDSREPRPSA